MVLINNKNVGNIGFGLMGLTWRPTPTPLPAAMAAMKTASESGARFWNGGTFYGPSDANSLHLLYAYFTQYPEDADQISISIKGPRRGDEQTLRSIVDHCLHILDGKKHLDIYQCARVDPQTPIEETIRVLAGFIKEGKLSGVGLSEPTAEMIRRAAAVHPIACVEVEFSLFAQEMKHNGVARTCAELGIPIVAYSPLGRGFLTGHVQRADELPDGDVRKPFPRIQPGNFENNIKLAIAVTEVAKRIGCHVSQLALAWVRHHSRKPGFPEVIPIPGATTSGRVRENAAPVSLTDAEFDELNKAVEMFEIIGNRYP